MAFRGEATEQLSQELVGGHNLNARLLALLRHPLDRRGQEAAVAMSQELSRVFKVSLFMLMSGPSGDSGRVVEVDMLAPEVTIRGGTSIGQRTPAKDKPICGGEDVTLPKKGKEAEVTQTETTASPDNDGYQWRKYGQKNIRNRKFARCYYKCMFSHERGCRAKKTVQQQDSSSRGRHPMFQVRYMNEHNCQQAVPDETMGATSLTRTKKNNNGERSHHFDPLHAQLENDIMASCLAMVIGGAAPAGPSSLAAPAGDPDGGHTPRLLDVGMDMDMDATTKLAEISPFSPAANAPPAPSSSSFLPQLLPVEASANVPAGGGHSWSMDPAVSMEDTFFLCGPLFSSVAAQSISQLD